MSDVLFLLLIMTYDTIQLYCQLIHDLIDSLNFSFHFTGKTHFFNILKGLVSKKDCIVSKKIELKFNKKKKNSLPL